jgi:hypothetical protein
LVGGYWILEWRLEGRGLGEGALNLACQPAPRRSTFPLLMF